MNPTNDNARRQPGVEENKMPCHFADLSAAAQRTRLLAALFKGPITTLDARRALDIMHPAMRVLELRTQGYDIRTIWTRQETEAGVPHRIARYVLSVKGGQHGA